MAKRFNIHEWQFKQRKQIFESTDSKYGVLMALLELLKSWEDYNHPYYKDIHSFIDKHMGNDDPVSSKFTEPMSEHHDDEDFPKLPKEVSKFLDKLRRANKKVYDQVEDIIVRQAKEKNEASMTGGGASFNAGAGEGYMTPNAFKKKRKKQ